MLDEDRRITYQQIEHTLGLDAPAIHSIPQVHLHTNEVTGHTKKFFCFWMPYRRMTCCREMLKCLLRAITGLKLYEQTPYRPELAPCDLHVKMKLKEIRLLQQWGTLEGVGKPILPTRYWNLVELVSENEEVYYMQQKLHWKIKIFKPILQNFPSTLTYILLNK